MSNSAAGKATTYLILVVLLAAPCAVRADEPEKDDAIRQLRTIEASGAIP